ncbi:tetratricopeptide repeat protein [Flavisolibacter nicotianae]|uniref:tetratricopeptide repeat protein n=1 Tax=Flavisolibacter nicotianae TaxID=2364882 RepID=UPI000EB19F20|nr:tetratricopeptide repeat protein [Flavisolibacter nicotianae]
MQRVRSALMAFLFLAVAQKVLAQDELDKYVTRLRISQAVGGVETASMSAGSFFLYGQGQFDNKNYPAAAHFFKDVLHKDPANAYANYQLAICLIRQNTPVNSKNVQDYLAKAFAAYPSLKERFARETSSTGLTLNSSGMHGDEKSTLPK